MKKYIALGLTIILGANIVALGGVLYNRLSETTRLSLTERELQPPYYSAAEKENSGISLSIQWRTPSMLRPNADDDNYYPYHVNEIKISKAELETLGFEDLSTDTDSWIESRELFWALEFDGRLHQAEIEKASMQHKAAIKAYDADSNENNNRRIKEREKQLSREKNIKSRLFFAEASADFKMLNDKYKNQSNIVIVKGLAKPYYHVEDKAFRLSLRHLAVRSIMVPHEYAKLFTHINNMDNIDPPSRYTVDISWGNRLEPWIRNIKKQHISTYR